MERREPRRVLEELLDDAVLERVVGEDHETTAGDEQPGRALEALLQGTELVVDVDAQGLERAPRRVFAPWAGPYREPMDALAREQTGESFNDLFPEPTGMAAHRAMMEQRALERAEQRIDVAPK